MADISKLNINGVEYDIKDEDARSGVSGIVNVSANDGTATEPLRTISIGGGVYSVKNSGFVQATASGLSSYWAKLASFNFYYVYQFRQVTLWVHNDYTDLKGIVYIRGEPTSATSFIITFEQIVGNLDINDFRLYYETGTTYGLLELWVDCEAQWSYYEALVLSETGSATVEQSFVTMYQTTFSTVQTPTLTNYLTLGNTSIANNAATATTATTSSYPSGFSASSSSATWGVQTGTCITDWSDGSGGDIAFRKNCPASGQTSVVIDGYFYQEEGNYPCLDTNNYISYALPLTGGTMTGDVSLASGTAVNSHAQNLTNYGFSSDGFCTRIESFTDVIQFRGYTAATDINCAYNLNFSVGGTDSSPNTITFPNKSGTVALTSDITSSSSSGGLTEDEVNNLIDNALSSYADSARVRCTRIQYCHEDTYIYDQLNLLREYFGLLGNEMYIQTITIISSEFYINCIGNYTVNGNGEFVSATLSCIYNAEVLTGDTIMDIIGNYHQGEVDLLVYWNPVSTVNAIIDGN